MPVKVNHTYRLELGDNAFWLLIWTMVACAFLALIGIIGHFNLKADELLAKTPAPLELACATSTSTRVHPACMAIAKDGEHR